MGVVSLPTTIVAGPDAKQADGLSGEAVLAAEVLYLDTTTNRWLKAVANDAAKHAASAVALNSAPAANQPLRLLLEGTANGLSGLKPGTILALSNVAGDVSDDYAGDLTEDVSYTTFCGVTLSATSARFKFVASGVQLNLV